MRIGLLTTSYPRWPSDPAGNFVAEHAAWLAAAGHDVEVLAAACPEASAGDHRGATAGIAVHRIPVPPGLFYAGGAPEALESGASLLSAARFSAALTRAAARRAHRWDAMVAHWLAPCALAAAAARPRLPLLGIAHSGDVHLLLRTGLAVPAAAALAAAGARTVFVSQTLRDRFAAALPAPLRRRFAAAPVCSMGIDTARFRALAAAAPPAHPYVLFLGRLVPIKGVDTLLAAAPRWRDHATTVIAGDGPERARLPATAGVRFTGEVRGRERDRLLAGASLVVMPSRARPDGRSEGMPLVALESMAAGVPLVASASGGLAELPADVVTHVPPGDPVALARAVTGLLGDPARRMRQSIAAREFAAARDWEVVGPRLLAALDG